MSLTLCFSIVIIISLQNFYNFHFSLHKMNAEDILQLQPLIKSILANKRLLKALDIEEGDLTSAGSSKDPEKPHFPLVNSSKEKEKLSKVNPKRKADFSPIRTKVFKGASVLKDQELPATLSPAPSSSDVKLQGADGEEENDDCVQDVGQEVTSSPFNILHSLLLNLEKEFTE